MRNIFYFLEEAGIHLRANKTAFLMTALTITFTMLLFGLFLWLHLNLSVLMGGLQSEIKIFLYLREGLPVTERVQIQERVQAEPGISEVRYISKEEALEDFKKSLEGNELLLRGLGENPLPASFELTVDRIYRSSQAMAKLVERLKNIKSIEEIQYGREWVENIEAWLRLFQIVTLSIGGLLAFAVITTIANSIQLTLSLRRDEVEILKLIGATRYFIGVPFILEGALTGFLSSGLALLLLMGLYALMDQNLLPLQGLLAAGSGFFFLPAPWMVGLLFGGTGLGCIGSYWSFRQWV
jgi:cell division transport system permease protein